MNFFERFLLILVVSYVNVSLGMENKILCSFIPELKHAAAVIKFEAGFIEILHYMKI